MKTLPYPEDWFQNVKKIYVIESVDYYTRRGSTTIIIKYKPLWKFRRKLKFARTRTTKNCAEMHEQSPMAKAIIAKIKETLKPAYKKALPESKSPMSALKSVLPTFADMPKFAGWPTAK